MARVCYVCKKNTKHGNSISHSHKKTKRKWKANLIYIKANINGSIKRIKICTRCLRSNKIHKVVSSKEKAM